MDLRLNGIETFYLIVSLGAQIDRHCCLPQEFTAVDMLWVRCRSIADGVCRYYLSRSNFGGVLIIFDRLFGTFAEEKFARSITYGLTDPLNSRNPLQIV